jgi:hypothetical protein
MLAAEHKAADMASKKTGASRAAGVFAAEMPESSSRRLKALLPWMTQQILLSIVS